MNVLCNKTHPVIVILCRVLYCYLFIFNLFSQNNPKYIDSLLQELNHSHHDSTLAKMYLDLSLAYEKLDVSKAIIYAQKSLEIYQKSNDDYRMIKVWYRLGEQYKDIGDYQNALKYGIKLLQSSDKIKDKRLRYRTKLDGLHLMIGVYFITDFIKAYPYIKEQLFIAKQIKDKEDEGIAQYNMGNYFIYSAFTEKEDSIKKYQYLDSAYESYTSAMNIFNSSVIPDKVSHILSCKENIATIYNHKLQYDKAIAYYLEIMRTYEEMKDYDGMVSTYNNISTCLMSIKKHNEAIDYLNKGISTCEKVGIYTYLPYLYSNLSEAYEKVGDYKNALLYSKRSKAVNDSIMDIEKSKNIQELSVKYETQLKDAENKILKSRTERQKIISWSIGIMLLLLSLVTFLVYKAYQNKNRVNRLITIQKQLIEQRNKDIIDSIIYAKRIQHAILPSLKIWKELLPNSFVLYLPKDKVAGDFYWMEDMEDYIYVAAADCTGHGVPGAIVSVICSNALTKAVIEDKQVETNGILDTTQSIVVEKLSKAEENIQDGMDICLIRIDKKDRRHIQYSGANRPLYIVSEKGEIQEIKPDKQPIGKYDNEQPFNKQDIILSSNDTIYLATDGYSDQFGGDKDKKFSAKSLRKLLSDIANKNIEQQKEIFLDTHIKWRGKLEQTDDITVIGIKIT